MAGLDLGVLPMGDWSITIALSKYSKPFISLCFPGLTLALFSFCARDLYSISFTNVDFPEPDTPVTQVNTPRGGIFASIFF